MVNDRIAKRQSRKALGKELEPDEGDRDAIKAVRSKLRDLLGARVPELVHEEDGLFFVPLSVLKSRTFRRSEF